MAFSLKSPLGVGILSAGFTLTLCLGLGYVLLARSEKTASETRARELEALQTRYTDEFRTFADRLLMTVESTDRKLSEAMTSNEDTLFLNDAEQRSFEQERIDALADAVSTRLTEAAKGDDSEVNQVVTRVSERINPILNEISQTGTMTRSDIQLYTHRISEQIATVLREEIEAKQQLNNNLLVSTGIARDSLALSGEMAALYVSSLKDEGMISRLLMLPVGLVQDAASLSIVGSSDRKKAEEKIFSELASLQDRLTEVEQSMPVVLDISPPTVVVPAPTDGK
ncbi:MAG: hypothetical protein R3F07_00815 [Opitutaceae bacterium]